MHVMSGALDGIGLGALTTNLATTAAKNVLNSKALLDPVDKLRVSNPENLIDTDFEYGLQSTKWETVQLVNNVPTFYNRDADGVIIVANVVTTEGSPTINVTTLTAHNLVVGSPFYIVGLNDVTAEGYYVVLYVINATEFIYRANIAQIATGSIFDAYTTTLFPARVYQGTQFNPDNIVSMETDESEESVISVVTKYPHGFLAGTSMILTNSVGQKELIFNAQTDVDPNNTTLITTQVSQLMLSGDSGYDTLSVNPYDWQSKKTIFFDTLNVSSATDMIEVTNHGLITNDTVMYSCPVGNTTIGGLVNNSPYKVVSVDSNNIQLKAITTNYVAGLARYRITGRTNTTTDFYTIDHNLEGTFITNMSAGTSTGMTMLFLGYFVATIAGTYQFRAAAGIEVRCSVYLGDNAVNNISRYVSTGVGAYTFTVTGATSAAYNVTLAAGQWLPIRVQAYGVNDPAIGVNTINVQFKLPGSATWLSDGGTVATTSFWRTPLSTFTIASSPVDMSGSGTSTYGYHTLHKCYPILSINKVTDQINIDMNVTNYLNASLASGDRLYVFSSIVGVGVPYTEESFGIPGTLASKNNISSARYSTYYIKGNPTVGAVTTPIQVSVSTATNATVVNVPTNVYIGTTWAIPGVALESRDSFYAPNHGFNTGYSVTYSIVNGTAIAGITSGQTYEILRLTPTRFRLTSNKIEVDIQSIGSGTIQFVYNAANANRDSFTILGHGLFNSTSVIYSNNGNTSISGLTNGTTYYVWDASDTKFRLSTSPSSLVRVDVLGTGTGIHKFTSTERATDGLSVIQFVPEANHMTLSYPFKIPSRTVSINPSIAVNIKRNVIYIPSHRQRTGTRLLYDNNGNTDIGGLTSGSYYYAIRVDLNYFQVANSYENAKNGTSITITSLGTGLNHNISFLSVMGEIATSSTVKLTSGLNTIVCPNEDLLSTTRLGDKIVVEITATKVDLTITLADIANGVLTIGTHGIVDNGTDVRFVAASNTLLPLVTDYTYYVRVISTTTVSLYPTPQDAIANTNKIVYTGTIGTSKLQKNLLGSVFESIISDINNSTVAKVETAPTSTTTIGKYVKTTTVYPRANGFTLHRAYDGGMELIPSNNPDSQIIRQTRKYFRYQSGKGIQMSGAINFSGPVDIEKLYRINNIAYIETKRPHRITTGITIIIANAVGDTSWNGEHEILSVPTDRTMTFELSTTPQEIIAGGIPRYFVKSWRDGIIRAGLFDEQNGMFYEYDGASLYACRRNSIQQIPGNVTVIFNSAEINGLNTRFTTQLDVGSRIVIKGVSYKVVQITSDNVLFIQPPYRGISNTGVIVTKTEDTKVPQSEWNIDRFDGTGESEYNIDIHRIQMAYIDYSWYGAGTIRFGFRTVGGQVRYGHSFIHNNNMTEAYMRSGNMPGHYEVATGPSPTYVPSLMHWGTSIIMDGRFDNDKAYWFTAASKIVSYAGGESVVVTANTLIFNSSTNVDGYRDGVTVNGYEGTYWRITVTAYSSVAYIASGTLVTGVGLATGTLTVGNAVKSGISAKGYIYIDRSPIAGGSATASLTLGSNDPIPSFIPLVSIRLAPSVDNGRPGPLGSREIINRMQLVLRQIGILTTNDVEVKLLLNAYPYDKSWVPVQSPSLCQLILHEKTNSISGGTQLYNFRVSGGSVDANGRHASASATERLEEITDLGNSYLGGDSTFPNGPDILTIGVSVLDFSGINIAAPFSITGRVTWTESQA